MRFAYCTLCVSSICWDCILAKATKGAICAPILLMFPFYIAASSFGVT